MNCRPRLRNQRPQAFWGALISAGAGLVGNLVSGISQNKAAKQQAAQRKAQAQVDNYNNLTNVINNTLSDSSRDLALVNQDFNNDYTFAKGGNVRRRLRNTIAITDGGQAEPIGDGLFLLRGSSHGDINETGNTGIGINVGGNQVEAEGGEVIEPTKNGLRIFSRQPIFDGVSPAELVETGVNPDNVFRNQERTKRRIRLRNPYSSPVERNKYPSGGIIDYPDPVVFKNSKWGLHDTWGDWANLGTDLLGSLTLGFGRRRALRNLERNINYEIPSFVSETPVAFDTRYRIGAQLAANERARQLAFNNVGRNTASSSTARDLMQEANTEALANRMQLYDTKFNKETELRNAQAANDQAVAARNAAARNEYFGRVAEIRNAQADARNQIAIQRANALGISLQGLGQAASNFFNQGRERFEDIRAWENYRNSFEPEAIGRANIVSSYPSWYRPITMRPIGNFLPRNFLYSKFN